MSIWEQGVTPGRVAGFWRRGVSGGFEFAAEVFGDLDDFSLAVDACDGGLGGAEEFAGLGVVHVVGVVDADVGLLDDAGGEGDFVVEAGGALVVDTDLGDDEEDAHVFEVLVAGASEAEEFCATDFHEGEIVGVVEETHGVAFDIADAEGDGAFGVHGGPV